MVNISYHRQHDRFELDSMASVKRWAGRLCLSASNKAYRAQVGVKSCRKAATLAKKAD